VDIAPTNGNAGLPAGPNSGIPPIMVLLHVMILRTSRLSSLLKIFCVCFSIFTRYFDLRYTLGECSALKLPTVVLACKADLDPQIEPGKVAEDLKVRDDVGLSDVHRVSEPGKTKMRQSFDFLLKAIFRARCESSLTVHLTGTNWTALGSSKLGDLGADYRNPALPDVLNQQTPWEISRTATPIVSSSISTIPLRPAVAGGLPDVLDVFSRRSAIVPSSPIHTAELLQGTDMANDDRTEILVAKSEKSLIHTPSSHSSFKAEPAAGSSTEAPKSTDDKNQVREKDP